MQKFKTDMPKDVSLAEAGKYGSLNDFAFFDKVVNLIIFCANHILNEEVLVSCCSSFNL